MFAKIAAAAAIATATIALSASAACAAPMVHHTTHQVGTAHQVGAGHTMASQTYWVYNATDQPLTIVGVTIDGNWDGVNPPTAGFVVPAGSSYRFDMEDDFAWGNTATVNFHVGSTATYLLAIAHVDGNSEGQLHGFTGSRFDGNGDNRYTFAVGGPQSNIVTLENTAQTVHNLSGEQGEAQYKAFNSLCDTGSLASCTFDAKSAVAGLGDERLVGTLLDAEGMPVDETMSWSHTTEMTSEWDIEAGLSVGVEGIVTAEVKTKYQQDYSTSDKASSEYHISVDKGNVGWLTYSPPVEKVTGDFTITLGNDTWNLTDVHFDLPKNSGGVGNGGEMHAYQLPKGNPGIPSGTEFVHSR